MHTVKFAAGKPVMSKVCAAFTCMHRAREFRVPGAVTARFYPDVPFAQSRARFFRLPHL